MDRVRSRSRRIAGRPQRSRTSPSGSIAESWPRTVDRVYMTFVPCRLPGSPSWLSDGVFCLTPDRNSAVLRRHLCSPPPEVEWDGARFFEHLCIDRNASGRPERGKGAEFGPRRYRRPRSMERRRRRPTFRLGGAGENVHVPATRLIREPVGFGTRRSSRVPLSAVPAASNPRACGAANRARWWLRTLRAMGAPPSAGCANHTNIGGGSSPPATRWMAGWRVPHFEKNSLHRAPSRNLRFASECSARFPATLYHEVAEDTLR